MRRFGILTALALTAVVLLGMWNLLSSPAPAADVTPQESQPGTYWMLYQRSVSDFERMSVVLASGESYSISSCMVYDANGNLLGVTSTLGQPVVVDGREDFALSSAAWQMMLVAAQNLPVTQSYPALDRDACGLSSPSARIGITYADGETITLSIGSKTASGQSCYVSIDGDSAVYLAPSDFYDVMTQPLKALHHLPGALAADIGSAGQAAVVGLSDGNVIATLSTVKGELLPWTVESPIRHSASTERVEALIEGVCAVHAQEYVATVYDMAGLSAYGLASPVRLIASFYDGTIRDIHVGSDAGDGMVYVRMDSTGDIYLVSREQLSFMDQATLDWLLDRFAALVPTQQMQSVRITLPEETVVMEQKWQEGDEAVASGYIIRGRTVDQQTFSGCYAAIIGLQFDKVAQTGAQPGKNVAQIEFCMRDGSTRIIAIHEYDEHYDLIETDGGGRFLARRERTREMLQALEE